MSLSASWPWKRHCRRQRPWKRAKGPAKSLQRMPFGPVAPFQRRGVACLRLVAENEACGGWSSHSHCRMQQKNEKGGTLMLMRWLVAFTLLAGAVAPQARADAV